VGDLVPFRDRAAVEPTAGDERHHGLFATGVARVRRSGRNAGDASVGAMRGLLGAVTGLYDRAVDSMLATPHAVPTAHEALRLLEERHRDSQHLGDQIGKVAVLAVPVVRKLQSAQRLTRLPGVRRLPWLASATTVAATAAALTRGVHDIQVLGSFVATRLESAGRPVDPELVKRVTVQLYLSPSSPVRLDQRVGPARLLRRWLVRGALGRDSKRAAAKAVSAVSRMDVHGLSAAWDRRSA
jgi:hypothetical protein